MLGKKAKDVKDSTKYGLKWTIFAPWDAYRAGSRIHPVVGLLVSLLTSPISVPFTIVQGGVRAAASHYSS